MGRATHLPPSKVLSYERAANGCAELGDRDRALELGLDAAVAADEEDPRLARQAPLAHPPVRPLGGHVVPVDLDVDEPDAVALVLPADGVDDVDDGAAGAARAVLRRREDEHERLA